MWAIPGPQIPKMSRGARRARAKTRSAYLKAAKGAHWQYPIRPYQGCRAARARKNQICPAQGGKRRVQAIPGAHITRMPRGARRAQKLDTSVSRRQAPCAGKTGSPITRMSCVERPARGARAQKRDLPVSRRQSARAGNTPFAHNKDVARRARAKTRSARLQAAGAARRQYPLRP